MTKLYFNYKHDNLNYGPFLQLVYDTENRPLGYARWNKIRYRYSELGNTLWF